MKVDIQLVKELRERTGIGLSMCRSALEASNNNIEDAIHWLRTQGVLKARAKEGRVNADGLVATLVDGNKAIILELNCETDFVAKNNVFINLLNKIAQLFLVNDIDILSEGLLLQDENGIVVEQLITDAILKTGEKISISRFNIIKGKDDETLASYSYPKNESKIASLVKLQGNNLQELGNKLAMHIVARKPIFINREGVSENFINQELDVIASQMANENKPPELLERIKKGRLDKQLAEYCLVDQPFMSDDTKKVGEVLTENNTKVLEMYRFEIGESSKDDE